MTDADDVMQEPQTVFQDEFEEEELVITPRIHPAEVEGWDSLPHATLVPALMQAVQAWYPRSLAGGRESLSAASAAAGGARHGFREAGCPKTPR